MVSSMLDQSIPSFRKFLASSGQAGGSPSLKQPSPLYLSNGCGAKINEKITNKTRVHDEKPIKISNGDEPVLSYKLQCYTRIPALRKTVTTHVKKMRYFFLRVFDIVNQLLTRHSPSHHLVRLMNERQSLHRSHSKVVCRNFLGLWLLKP